MSSDCLEALGESRMLEAPASGGTQFDIAVASWLFRRCSGTGAALCACSNLRCFSYILRGAAVGPAVCAAGCLSPCPFRLSCFLRNSCSVVVLSLNSCDIARMTNVKHPSTTCSWGLFLQPYGCPWAVPAALGTKRTLRKFVQGPKAMSPAGRAFRFHGTDISWRSRSTNLLARKLSKCWTN